VSRRTRSMRDLGDRCERLSQAGAQQGCRSLLHASANLPTAFRIVDLGVLPMRARRLYGFVACRPLVASPI
jgi:hypothetical protein